MGVIIPSGFGLVSIWSRTEGDSEEMAWTFGIDHSGNTDKPSLPGEIQTAWHDNLEPLTSSVVTQTRVTVKLGPTSTGPTYEFSGADVGSNSESLAPPNCAVLALKHTAYGGRRGRGRAYLPGISSVSSSMTSAGIFSAGDAGEVQTALNGMQADLLTEPANGPIEQVLLHSDATTPYPILSWSVSTKLATQRRRLRP